MVDEELRLAKDQQAKYDSVRLAYDAAVKYVQGHWNNSACEISNNEALLLVSVTLTTPRRIKAPSQRRFKS
jgi:ABC-type branched-subunit amino acid transport system substrate-binding protein